MQSIKLQSHVGPDGILKLQIPIGLSDVELEVLVVVQALAPVPETTTPEAFGWPSGFFEQTAGALADDPLLRGEQGDYEVREELE